MDKMNWKAVDLNLLVAFSSLYSERSVSVAAEKNHVSQSAMSHSLSRLRLLFQDPLFERYGHQMQPTERADQLASMVENVLEQVQHQLLPTSTFSRQSYQGVCRIGLSDYAEFIFAPVIFDLISQQAPQAQVSFVQVNRHNYAKVMDEEPLDILIGSIPQLESRFESQHLYRERHVCLYDPQQVPITSPMTLSQFTSVRHALVTPDGSLTTKIDAELSSQKRKRQVAVASRNFLTIRHLIKGRSLICTVPEMMAQMHGLNDGLAMVSPPMPVDDFDILMVWRKNKASSEKLQWLREVLEQAVTELKQSVTA